MKKIILFDYDGVIVDSLYTMFGIFNSICGKYNLKKIDNKDEFVELLDSNFYETLKQKGVSGEVVNKLIIDIRDRVTRQAESINLFAGIANVVNILSETYQLIIITSNLTQVVEDLLISKKITKFADVIGADQEKSKVKKILQVKSQYPQAELYYVGDTIGDIGEAKQAGIVTIAVTWGYHSKEKLKKSNPDYIVDSTQELIELFENLS